MGEMKVIELGTGTDKVKVEIIDDAGRWSVRMIQNSNCIEGRLTAADAKLMRQALESLNPAPAKKKKTKRKTEIIL